MATGFDFQEVIFRPSEVAQCPRPALRIYNIQAEIATNHVTKHNILSTAPQLSISQKALGKLPEDGNVMPKHVGATIHN
jgi:hypothetical protein